MTTIVLKNKFFNKIDQIFLKFCWHPLFYIYSELLKIKAYVKNSYKLTWLSKFEVKDNISVIFMVKLLQSYLKWNYIDAFWFAAFFNFQ